MDKNKIIEKYVHKKETCVPAFLTGLGAFMLSLVLLFIDPGLSIFPLAVFVVLCIMAPFIQGLNFFIPVIGKNPDAGPFVAITFDDGPDPVTTPMILHVLSRFSVKAAFFVIGEKAERHPELIEEILASGHEIGNHSHRHDVFLMLRSFKVLCGEIARCQDALEMFGIRPLAFRPPVGITNPKLLHALKPLGMYCAGFSLRPSDFGNQRVRGLKEKVLKSINPGDIVLLHDRSPGPGFNTESWIKEIEGILSGISGKNLEAIPLSELIKIPVMEPVLKRDKGKDAEKN